MAAELYPVAGMKIFIGGVLASKKTNFSVADFASQTWVEIDGWETAGNLGDSAQVITTSLINRNRDIKQKGTRNAGQMQNNFAIVSDDPGQIALIAAEKSPSNYAYKIEGSDSAIGTPATVTITIASPGVVTQTAHGKANGDKVVLSTTGKLPDGLDAGVTYYVVAQATNTYQLALTPGGAAIVTTGTQTGVHTSAVVGLPSTRYFIALNTGAPEQGGSANTIQMLQATLEVNSNIVKVAPATVA